MVPEGRVVVGEVLQSEFVGRNFPIMNSQGVSEVAICPYVCWQQQQQVILEIFTSKL